MRTSTILALVVLTAAPTLGCNPARFSKLEDTAPVRVFEPSETYPKAGFGTVLTAYNVTVAGHSAARIAASGGDDTPTRIFGPYEQGNVSVAALLDVCDSNSSVPCSVTHGSALAGAPDFMALGTSCIVIGAPAAGTVILSCQAPLPGCVPTPGSSCTGVFTIPPNAGSRLGESLVSVPSGIAASTGIRAFAGAPDTNGGAGSVFAVTSGQSFVEITNGAIDGVFGLGRRMAAANLDSRHVLLAVASAKPMQDSKVVILFVDSTNNAAEVRACIDTDLEDGTAAVVALGDLNDDGFPEVIVGEPASETSRTNVIHVYDGAALPDTGAPGSSCPAWPTLASGAGVHPATVLCPVEAGFPCASSNFGAALAVADVNADGVGDLIVGAPSAAIGDANDAGAVLVFPGGNGGAGARTPAVLTNSEPRTGGRLGASVAAFESEPGRFEVVAGEIGGDLGRVLVFYCTGLPDDSFSEAAPLCTVAPMAP